MSGRPSLRIVLVLVLALATTATVVAHGGIGGSIKKIGDKATKKAEEVKGEAKDTQKPADEKSGAATGEGGSAAPPTRVSAVSTKFDFVPGDSVMFFDDFTQDDLGEFPKRWGLKDGTFEVAELAGERWLRCTSHTGQVAMKVAGLNGLPEFWTLEFDFYHDASNGANALTIEGMAANGQTAWQTIYPYSGTNFAFHTGAVTANVLPEAPVAGNRHRVRFMGRGPALKAYLDNERVVNAPDVTGPGVPAEILLRLGAPDRPMITNVRFAEGARPPKDMLAEGKLVTYGIFFATGSDVVLPESAPVIRQVASYLESNPNVKLRITGHTDNVGTAASNADLSKRRAASVAKVLAEQFSIAADRLEADGKGDTQPIAANTSGEGKAKNRRVEFAKL